MRGTRTVGSRLYYQDESCVISYEYDLSIGLLCNVFDAKTLFSVSELQLGC